MVALQLPLVSLAFIADYLMGAGHPIMLLGVSAAFPLEVASSALFFPLFSKFLGWRRALPLGAACTSSVIVTDMLEGANAGFIAAHILAVTVTACAVGAALVLAAIIIASKRQGRHDVPGAPP